MIKKNLASSVSENYLFREMRVRWVWVQIALGARGTTLTDGRDGAA